MVKTLALLWQRCRVCVVTLQKWKRWQVNSSGPLQAGPTRNACFTYWMCPHGADSERPAEGGSQGTPTLQAWIGVEAQGGSQPAAWLARWFPDLAASWPWQWGVVLKPTALLPFPDCGRGGGSLGSRVLGWDCAEIFLKAEFESCFSGPSNNSVSYIYSLINSFSQTRLYCP